MQELVSRLPSQLSDVAEQIKLSLLHASSVNPSASVTDLIKLLENNRTEAVKTFTIKLQASDNLISETDINQFYLSCITDLYTLSATSVEVQSVMEAHDLSIKERLGKLNSIIKSQESELRELTFIRDNADFLEAFDQDLSMNYSSDESSAVYNSLENRLGLKTVASNIASTPDISIRVLGTPDRKMLPSYGPEKLVDRFNLSAWYEIVSYKEKRSTWLDTSLESVESYSKGRVAVNSIKPVKGTNKLPTLSLSFKPGEWISIGYPTSPSHESIKVIGVNVLDKYLLLGSTLKFSHFVGEPIYSGRNLVQANGAVAVIDMHYSYPQQVNFVKYVPFSSSPVKVHGIFVPSGSSFEPWKKIDGSEVRSLNDIKSKTFNLETSTKFRVIIEQPYGNTVSKTVSVTEEVSDITWDSIYEHEFSMKAQGIESKLSGFTDEEVRKASSGGYRGLLVRKAALDSITVKNSSYVGDSTTAKIDSQVSTLSEFLGTSTSSSVQLTRVVYDIGLAEIEFMNNTYTPVSYFEGPVINPKQNAVAFSLLADEIVPTGTSICHSLKIETGELIPIPNASTMSSEGEVESRNELIDIDPATKVGVLRFTPSTATVKVNILIEGSVPMATVVRVQSDRTITIPDAVYSQKYIYQATYPILNDKIHLAANIIAVPTSKTYSGTDDNGFIELEQNPFIDLAIINNKEKWIKRNRLDAVWTLNPSEIIAYTSDNSFPLHGFISNNKFYGHAGTAKVARTPELEALLYAHFSKLGGDSKIWVDRFFNSYVGNSLKTLLTYSPITVTVDGVVASNLTNYDGAPDNGFSTAFEMSEQYHHFSNRIKFPTKIESTSKIKVEYLFKASTIQYIADLYVNKKSNFWVTPLLNNALIGTIG